ncbi:hypothetical protein RhiirA4_477526 [Rhizophagus irregularis]|uniref:Uncharacterized protein n=1 Tax=Rhizophagus irregularis TaxID=588596 RepID=A0A2I1HDE5_9GLOM|nr:hypothetical protein RhiirA4_477526 [Rhizophagus irregularis]
MNKKLGAEVNTKIANELSARLSEVNSTFTAKLVRNNNELNKKLIGEITKINSLNASIDALQNGLIQYYAIARRNQSVETDKQSVSNHSEASSGKEMCLHVVMEIHELGGNIKKVMVQGFYERNIKKKDGYISTLDDIGLWLDSKLSVNNNASNANNNAE